ncbi:MAG: hypothetical protein ABI304_05675 [Rudaea sp.]
MNRLHAFLASTISIFDHKQSGGAAFGFALTAALVLVCKVSLAAAATIGSGYSAMWYDPARSGEGLQLEILDADHALVEWYTYDEQGGQRWLQGVGQIVHDPAGDSIKFPQLYDTHGGHFGPNFNPADVQLNVVGDATLSFGDCNTGTFTYHAYGQSQTLPMQRLTQTMGAGCESINGIPGQPVMDYAGQSGSWYDTSHSGEGFALQWLATGQAIVTWYTYDTQGNQVWLLGVGAEQNGSIVFDQMAITSGAHFGTAFDPASVQKEDWGTLTLQIDCNGGTAHYASKQAAFGTGDLNLTRLTTLAQPACPTVTPKLSDLYNITWDEIPIQPWTDANPTFQYTDSIAQDGTIAGSKNQHLMLWHPNTRIWEEISSRTIGGAVKISPDGTAVISVEASGADMAQPVNTLVWRRSSGFQALPGDAMGPSYHLGVSDNFQYVVGDGRDTAGKSIRWIRTENDAQRLLPGSDEFLAEHPYAVSNDGNVVVGVAATHDMGADVFSPPLVAVRWENGTGPTVLRNSAGERLAHASICNADCSIIFGDGIYQPGPDNPQGKLAWYLRSDGQFDYLGALADGMDNYSVNAASADGSLAVGTYRASGAIVNSNGTFAAYRAFIWTQATGIVSVSSLIDDLGIGDNDWIDASALSVSPDGLKILLSGTKHGPQQPHQIQVPSGRAAVLQLTPKTTPN